MQAERYDEEYGISLVVSFVVKLEGDERINRDCLCYVFLLSSLR